MARYGATKAALPHFDRAVVQPRVGLHARALEEQPLALRELARVAHLRRQRERQQPLPERIQERIEERRKEMREEMRVEMREEMREERGERRAHWWER